MAATIKIKNSSTASAVPTSSDLVQGELAVNVTDKRIFTENASGTVVELGTNPSILTLPDGSASAPTLTNDGDTNTGIFFPAADTVGITTGGTERARVDSSGNLGLGVTPSAWQSGRSIIELGGSVTGQVVFNGSSNNGFIATNVYNSGSGNLYKNSSYATSYNQTSGQHQWYTAASGTAGNAITFTQAMTLDASGNLGVGTTTTTYRVNFAQAGGGGTFYNSLWQAQSAGNPLAWNIDVSSKYITSSYGAAINCESGNGAITFYNAPSGTAGASATLTERARIDSSGNLLVGVTGGSNHRLCKAVAQGTEIVQAYSTTTGNVGFTVFGVSNEGYNAAATSIIVGKNSSTSRSINAGGTVNASGADYAEYMTKAGDFTVAKGDVVGINAEGKLTNVFADAVSFVVKSTDPSYVGGDVWGSEAAIGLTKPADDATQEEKDAFESALEAARQSVDRIAFAGQVPVNVIGATAGQYIVPVNDNGTIKGQAVSNPTFEQYQQAVGKIIAIEQDGRARIIVKVA